MAFAAGAGLSGVGIPSDWILERSIEIPIASMRVAY